MIKLGKYEQKPWIRNVQRDFSYTKINKKTLGDCCNYCQKKDCKLHIDHKIPVCLGGTNEKENLQLLCGDCHKVKTKKDRQISRIADKHSYIHSYGGGWAGGWSFVLSLEELKEFYNFCHENNSFTISSYNRKAKENYQKLNYLSK